MMGKFFRSLYVGRMTEYLFLGPIMKAKKRKAAESERLKL